MSPYSPTQTILFLLTTFPMVTWYYLAPPIRTALATRPSSISGLNSPASNCVRRRSSAYCDPSCDIVVNPPSISLANYPLMLTHVKAVVLYSNDVIAPWLWQGLTYSGKKGKASPRPRFTKWRNIGKSHVECTVTLNLSLCLEIVYDPRTERPEYEHCENLQSSLSHLNEIRA